MVPPCSGRISRVPPYSSPPRPFTRTGLSPAEARLSRRFRLRSKRHWPGPRSLATTDGVSVDVLSSGYGDVSVPRVRFLNLCIQFKIQPKLWVSPFGNLRIKAYSQLPVAYRSVSRPSSPLSAKASTKCPYFTCSLSLPMPIRFFKCLEKRRYNAKRRTDRQEKRPNFFEFCPIAAG